MYRQLMKTFIKKPHKIKLASFNLLTKNNNNKEEKEKSLEGFFYINKTIV